MKYYTLKPPPELAPYVRCFWIYEGEASEQEPFVHRSYADGCAEMVFHHRGAFDQVFEDGRVERSFRAGVHAQSAQFSRFITGEDFAMFGVYLYPYAIPKLFSMPATDLTGQMPDLGSIFGRAGRELEERVMQALTGMERARIVSEFLIERLNKTTQEVPIIFSSISHIIEAKGLIDIGTLSDRFFSSPRNFERRFKEFAGLPPKLFSRIIRFQSTVKEYGKTGQSLTDIAYEFGYYDQSHFIREFREFSGYNPKVFFSGKAEGADYLGL
jgi:AraC-like DNA-binding protein